MNDELFKIIGKLTYSYNRIDFLLSYLGERLEVVNDRIDFLSELNFKSKIDKLIEAVQNKNEELENPSRYTEWLRRLDSLRLKRNVIIHSIVLQNCDEKEVLRFFNYRKQKGVTVRIIEDYTLEDLRMLDNDFVNCHNEGFLLLDEIS